jgi:mannosyl-3-phosphoglycerate phosphatase family protein
MNATTLPESLKKMPGDNTKWLLITDLDGTFLNHHDYSYGACVPTLEKLACSDIPVIFNTSKTYSETIGLQQQLNINAPFIVENGSALFLPLNQFPAEPVENAVKRDNFWQIVIGETIENIHEKLKAITKDIPDLVLLSQSTPEQISILTGLDNKQAINAINREFSEPLLLKNDKNFSDGFFKKVTESGLTTLQGGRFLHVLGNCNKGTAIELLTSFYEQPVKTMALGDSANDAAMLLHADIAVAVNAPGNHSLLELVSPSYITELEAPAGWVEGIDYALHIIREAQTP